MTSAEANTLIESLFHDDTSEDEIFTGFQLKDIIFGNNSIEAITKALVE